MGSQRQCSQFIGIRVEVLERQNQILGSTLRGFGECLECLMSPGVVEVVIGVVALGWMVARIEGS